MTNLHERMLLDLRIEPATVHIPGGTIHIPGETVHLPGGLTSYRARLELLWTDIYEYSSFEVNSPFFFSSMTLLTVFMSYKTSLRVSTALSKTEKNSETTSAASIHIMIDFYRKDIMHNYHKKQMINWKQINTEQSADIYIHGQRPITNP